jgi:preprotein translocase subunit SecA
MRHRGVHSGESRLLRAYLSETALGVYFDRFARLSQFYDRSDLEAVERVWVLRAIDERWQRHLVEMQVLRSSVNVRAFGQLDPMEEYRIDGARSFVDMVRDLRRKTLMNVFFFVGSAVEPTLDFELEEAQLAEAADMEAFMREESVATADTAVRSSRARIADVLTRVEAERETVEARRSFRDASRRAAAAAPEAAPAEDAPRAESGRGQNVRRRDRGQRAGGDEEEDEDADADAKHI